MKIGIDIRLIGKKRTGDEVVFFNLVKNLAEIDRDNDYLLFTDITDTSIIEKIKNDLEIKNKNNFEVVTLTRPTDTFSQEERGIRKKPFCNKFTWNFWTLPMYLWKNPIDIYLTQYITPFFVSRKIKIATIIHDISFKVFPEFIKKSDLFFLNLLIPLSLRRADKIIGVSRFTQNEIIKYYSIKSDKVDHIHNAVSDDFLIQDISGEKVKLVKKKYNLPKKYILYLGTLQPRKNIPTLLEAYAKLINTNQGDNNFLPYTNIRENLRLVIAGGKGHNYDQRIEEVIKKNNLSDKIIFPGFIDEEDKAAVLAGAEIFCFPSFYEGFGIPILEAMSVGVPVVASKISPHEEITHEAALLFVPHDSKELAEKLVRVLENSDLKETLIRKGKEQIKKFSWLKTAERMKKIFDGMK